MRERFKLKGTPEENFKKIEQVIPRLMGKMQQKVSAVVPASVLHVYQETVAPDGLIFSGCVFAGQLNKIAFAIKDLQGDKKVQYRCVVHKLSRKYTYDFSTKKVRGVEQIQAELSDGDFVELWQLNPEEVVVSGIHISISMFLTQERQVKQAMIEELQKPVDLIEEKVK